MCSPAIALVAVSTAVQAYGQYQQGQASAKTAKANQRIATAAAVDAQRRGQYEEYATRAKVAGMIGRQRAAIGASGADVGSGSALDSILDSSAIGELDSLMVRNNAAREAWGYQAQSSQFGSDARAARMAATWGMGATILGGVSQAYGSYKNMKLGPGY